MTQIKGSSRRSGRKGEIEMDEMTNPLRWMLEVSEARDNNPRAKTVNLKFARRTLHMWQRRAREALAAASDMLALVQEAACPGGIGQHEFSRPGGWLDRAHAAIAKAEGRKGR